MKLLTPLVIVTTMIASSAMAQVDTMAVEQPITGSINTLELNHVFDTTQLDQVQALELSKQEMKETEGAFLPLALLYPILAGAAIGVASNTGFSLITTGQLPTWQSQAFSAGTGAVGGAYTNIMLKGAGIATSPFVSSAWQGSTGVANATIRVNGAMLGQSYVGVNKVNIPANATRPTLPSYTSSPNAYANNMTRYNVPLGYYR